MPVVGPVFQSRGRPMILPGAAWRRDGSIRQIATPITNRRRDFVGHKARRSFIRMVVA
jgi:hypothetical protein